jgi:galactonate dehydratase
MAGVAMKIARIEAFPLRVPRDTESATGMAGSPTMLIGAGDYRWSQAYPALYSIHFETALVRVTLDTGLVGWGESQAPLAPQVACTIIRVLLAPVLEDQSFDGSIDRIRELWQQMYSTMRVRGQTGGFMLDAISGIDLALWDLAGKISKRPARYLFPAAKTGRTLPAYLSGLPGSNARERVENAKPFIDQGFRIVKLYFDRTPEDLLRTMDALQSEFRGIEIAVDALWRFSLDDAIVFGRELDQRNIRWFECPLLPEIAAEHAVLAREIRTPIALGESYRTVYELHPFLHSRAVRLLQPDLGRSGLTESLRIAKAAEERTIPVVPHVSIAAGPQIAAAMHFACLAPTCDLVEYNPRVLEIANRFLVHPIRIEDAHYLVPEENGLGVEMEAGLSARAEL